ncbi:hypothetical protein GALMADRAFT_1051061 [Galerina marginata CBS 339.88]|uniref:BTB domain-containing protein n=1 Tax=Galerina marginata (strain CBS 339.88) TaxID=685588 RepID=A0A067SK37_GALM3|nr:hypothetical protein GALMADRAFT_1051061 [Galerina marginata CBS 339.88]
MDSIREKAALTWRDDLKSLLLNAKSYYPDVVWEIQAQEQEDEKGVCRESLHKVWGHQAVIHARAPQRLRSLFLPNPEETWTGAPGAATLSDPSICHCLKVPGHQDHELFIEGLQYFYTAELDPGTSSQTLLDELLEDFVTISRTQRFSDVEIHVMSPSDLEVNYPAAPTIFYSHRFILSSRSTYFRNIIASSSRKDTANPYKPLIIQLPYPLFTPASINVLLRYIYTGTLERSLKSEDYLSTAFSILRGAEYLALPALKELIIGQIILEMLHGLFLAPLSNVAYMKLTSGQWTNMEALGCRCSKCAHRAPLVLQLSLADDTKNDMLERGARRALVALVGEGWKTEQLFNLPIDTKRSILDSIQAIITPSNVLPLLFAVENALRRPHTTQPDYLEQPMIYAVRDLVEKCLCSYPQACFQSKAWDDILQEGEKDVEFCSGSDREDRVGWVMKALLRGADLDNWAVVHPIVMALRNPRTRRQASALIPANIFFKAETKAEDVITQRECTPSPKGRQSPEFSLRHIATRISFYSNASSRTNSTDYGIYYTRMALSQETIDRRDAGSPITRKSSFDSFWAQEL